MLNFDQDRFLRIQSGAVALAPRIHEIVTARLRAPEANLFFVGTGGAQILMHPAARLLQSSSTLPVFSEMAAELVLLGSPHLGEHSLVVMPSLSGTTPETLEALEYCRNAGAEVVALTAHADSPLAQQADETLVNYAEDDTSSESFYLQSLIIALSAMSARGEVDDYAELVRQLTSMPQLLLQAKVDFEPRAGVVANFLASSEYHIVTGAGGTWPEAFYYGMCILEEMQWIRTRPVHASDFFHGTLELVEQDVSLLLLKGEDAGRVLVERVEKFAPTYTDVVLTLDSADAALQGLPTFVRRLVSPIVLATWLERVSAHLEVMRAHPLTTRRYYKQVEY